MEYLFNEVKVLSRFTHPLLKELISGPGAHLLLPQSTSCIKIVMKPPVQGSAVLGNWNEMKDASYAPEEMGIREFYRQILPRIYYANPNIKFTVTEVKNAKAQLIVEKKDGDIDINVDGMSAEEILTIISKKLTKV